MPTALVTPEVLVNRPHTCVDRLADAGIEVVYPEDPVFSRGHHDVQSTIRQLSVCDAVIAGAESYSREVLAALPRLRVIARAGVGYDCVDVGAATERNIVLTVTPTANHESVAEHAMMLLLSVSKRLPFNDRRARAGEWPMQQSFPVRGTTVGILGLGRIGRSFAVRAAAFGTRLIATEKYPDQEFVRKHRIELVDQETLLASSDFLSLHCPLNDETRGTLNQSAFERMKRGSVLINTARGGLVVESDLISALTSGHLRGAGLDCFEQEPPSANNPLFEMEQVVCTPHIAGSDVKSQHDMAVEAADCIARLYQGEWPDAAIINNDVKQWKW